MHILNHTTTPNRIQRPIKVMQFGGGNFLRAFVDWMVHVLNQETDFNGDIAIVKPTAGGDYSELNDQDGLFTVVLDGIKNGKLVAEKTLVTEVQSVIHSYNEWASYLKLAENEDLRFVVSNTTEAGIKFNADDKFDVNPPREFPAKLTVWLYHRFKHFKGDVDKGCILLPCELIEDNGTALKKTVLQYADHWNLDNDFKNWIHTANHFCSTLVDRIVSGYPTDRADEIEKELGYNDELLVAGEYYHSWVIQADEAVQKELPFAETDLNVEFVKDLAPYREMKVRILNGAHTSMVPVGYLAGIRFVKEAMEDEDVSHFTESLLLEEAAQTLDFPNEVKNKFVADVLDRFRNPLLKHQLISISLNSTSKFVARLLPTLKDYYNTQGQLPRRIVFGLSALLRFYKGEFRGETINLNDDKAVLAFFASAWKKVDDGTSNLSDFVETVLKNDAIWGEDLTQIQGLTNCIAENIQNIEAEGIVSCLRKL
ncbi:tagaturonate reductase [Zobellia uliginosa]|uniref:Tagaturonate reductase n=1 Tax=Zobellia uliginosa TaxID=143224 RepID=A0ABY1KR28_9FLAO|nr:tagaturonate reductase [Zobellia uliginosa]SIS67276.1 tagaturonate reductase [Zobellia uliginosa]